MTDSVMTGPVTVHSTPKFPANPGPSRLCWPRCSPLPARLLPSSASRLGTSSTSLQVPPVPPRPRLPAPLQACVFNVNSFSCFSNRRHFRSSVLANCRSESEKQARAGTLRVRISPLPQTLYLTACGPLTPVSIFLIMRATSVSRSFIPASTATSTANSCASTYSRRACACGHSTNDQSCPSGRRGRAHCGSRTS